MFEELSTGYQSSRRKSDPDGPRLDLPQNAQTTASLPQSSAAHIVDTKIETLDDMVQRMWNEESMMNSHMTMFPQASPQFSYPGLASGDEHQALQPPSSTRHDETPSSSVHPDFLAMDTQPHPISQPSWALDFANWDDHQMDSSAQLPGPELDSFAKSFDKEMEDDIEASTETATTTTTTTTGTDCCASSDCDLSDCQSQCCESDPGTPCQDAECFQACDDDECNPETRCSDHECVSQDCEEPCACELEQAAETLKTLHHNPDGQIQPQSHGLIHHGQQPCYHHQNHIQAHNTGPWMDGNTPVTTGSQFMNSQVFTSVGGHMAPQMSMVDPMAMGIDPAMAMTAVRHAWQQHDPSRPSALCEEECPFDEFTSTQFKCPLPQYPHAHPGQVDFCQSSTAGANMACGHEFDSAWQWLDHINTQHRPALANDWYPMPFPGPSAMPDTFHMGNLPQHQHAMGMCQLEDAHTRSSSVSTMPTAALSDSFATRSPSTPATEAPFYQTLSAESGHSHAAVDIDHEGKPVCKWSLENGSICGMVFKTDEELHNHCRQDHVRPLEKNDGGFPCLWHGCLRKTKAKSRDKDKFTQKSKLERHLQTHTGFKPVECLHCGERFSAKQSLEQHVRIHTGLTPWVCAEPGCGKKFKQQSALTMHRRTHTREKPLRCEICGKAFSESSNLSKHRRIHDSRGKHDCNICGRNFKRKEQLDRHREMHTKKRAKLASQSEESSFPESGVLDLGLVGA